MEVTTNAFKNEGEIPERYRTPAAGGENVSIPFSWTDPPKGTASFALLMVDPQAVGSQGIHWIVTNIPADVRSIKDGASREYMPLGSVELLNSFGMIGYGGPQPPESSGAHRYVAVLFALDVPNVHPGVKPTVEEFMSSIRGNVLAEASVTGVFERYTPEVLGGAPMSGQTVRTAVCSDDRGSGCYTSCFCCV